MLFQYHRAIVRRSHRECNGDVGRARHQEKKTMSIIDRVIEANRTYAKNHKPSPAGRPAPKVAVVTCMDPRLSDLPAILGLPHADLDVIRTGGPAVTQDVLAEL